MRRERQWRQRARGRSPKPKVHGYRQEERAASATPLCLRRNIAGTATRLRAVAQAVTSRSSQERDGSQVRFTVGKLPARTRQRGKGPSDSRFRRAQGCGLMEGYPMWIAPGPDPIGTGTVTRGSAQTRLYIMEPQKACTDCHAPTSGRPLVDRLIRFQAVAVLILTAEAGPVLAAFAIATRMQTPASVSCLAHSPARPCAFHDSFCFGVALWNSAADRAKASPIARLAN